MLALQQQHIYLWDYLTDGCIQAEFHCSGTLVSLALKQVTYHRSLVMFSDGFCLVFGVKICLIQNSTRHLTAQKKN